VLLPHAWQYIVPLGIAKERVVWIPNGVDLSLFPRLNPSVNRPDKGFTLMYFGAHGQANGLDNVLQAMQLVQQSAAGSGIGLRLIGDGPLKPELQARAAAMGLSNVTFEPSVPKSQIPVLAAQADAFVIAVLDLPQLYRFGISMNKLFDYLAAERPILIASNAANNPVADAKAGISVPAGQADMLAGAILKLAATPLEERERMGRAGREYVEQNHGFEQLAGRLAMTLDAVHAEQAAGHS
jgi:glycosyltransferase involved in cell wall biosynthesis